MTNPRAERRGKSLGRIAYNAGRWDAIYTTTNERGWQGEDKITKAAWERVANAIIKAYRAKPASAGKGKR